MGDSINAGKETRRARFLLFCFCLLPHPDLRVWTKPTSPPKNFEFAGLLPPPPKEDSAEGKRDLQILLDLQKNMTPARMAAIEHDVDQSVYTVAGSVLGPKFTKENFPLAGEFFAKVVRDAGVGVG